MNDKVETVSMAKKNSGFTQVSLPIEFAQFLRNTADLHGRSMAAQLQTWAHLAVALETVLPVQAAGEIRRIPLTEPQKILDQVLVYVSQSNTAGPKPQYQHPGQLVLSADPTDPTLTIRQLPSGKTERGTLDEKGRFKPLKANHASSTPQPPLQPDHKRRRTVPRSVAGQGRRAAAIPESA